MDKDLKRVKPSTARMLARRSGHPAGLNLERASLHGTDEAVRELRREASIGVIHVIAPGPECPAHVGQDRYDCIPCADLGD